MKQSSTRLNWRTYLPADEREYELYSIAYRRSYSFLVGVLLSVVGFYKVATVTENLRPPMLHILLLVYILIGFLLAEFVGSRVFVGHDVSFSKKRPAFAMVEGTWGGLFLLVGYMAVGFAVVTFLANFIN